MIAFQEISLLFSILSISDDAFTCYSREFVINAYLFSLVILYKHYEADTEADKGAPHVSSCYGSFCAFYLYGVLLQWLAN